MRRCEQVFPRVSVVMPVYNSEKYLSEAIESILSQTLKELELIIIDDGSQDHSIEIIQSFQDSRIHLIKNGKNIGNYPSRNIGMRAARGKYIAVMDSDDIAFPERLQKQFEYMEENPEVGIVGCRTQLSSGGVWLFSYSPEHLKEMLLRSNCICHPGMFFRKKVIWDFNLFYNEYYCYSADYEILTRAVDHVSIRIVPEILLKYRIHNSQISKSKKDQQTKFAEEIRLKFVKKTGACLNQDEENAFICLFRGDNHFSDPELYIETIDKIIDANKESRYFDQKELTAILARRLYYCLRRRV